MRADPHNDDTQWGLYDSKDLCWLGDLDGPFLYGIEDVAKVAREVLTVSLGWPFGRLKALVYADPMGLYTDTIMRDTVDVKMDASKALQMLEEGLV